MRAKLPFRSRRRRRRGRGRRGRRRRRRGRRRRRRRRRRFLAPSRVTIGLCTSVYTKNKKERKKKHEIREKRKEKEKIDKKGLKKNQIREKKKIGRFGAKPEKTPLILPSFSIFPFLFKTARICKFDLIMQIRAF